MIETALGDLSPNRFGSLEKRALLWESNTIKFQVILAVVRLEIKPITFYKVYIIIQTLMIRKLNHRAVKCFPP